MNPGLSDLKCFMEGVSLSMDDIDDAEKQMGALCAVYQKNVPGKQKQPAA